MLEYQWTNTRDLIENVEVDLIDTSSANPSTKFESPRQKMEDADDQTESQEVDREAESKSVVTRDVSMKSLIAALEDMGFGLEPEHRVSFYHPDK